MKNKINIIYDDEAKSYKRYFLADIQIKNWVELIAKQNDLKNFELSIYFCSDEYIKNLNKTYRNIDEVTDVLSFSQLEGEEFVTPGSLKQLGDIVICLAQTMRQAEEDGHDNICEEQMLICHGMLHLLGYDHVTDDGEMFALQEKILNKIRPNKV